MYIQEEYLPNFDKYLKVVTHYFMRHMEWVKVCIFGWVVTNLIFGGTIVCHGLKFEIILAEKTNSGQYIVCVERHIQLGRWGEEAALSSL